MDFRTIIEKLSEQGWEVVKTANGHTRAIPPDKTKAIVHFATSSSDPRSLKNTLADLRRNGFVWEDEPRSKRNPAAAPEQPHLQIVPTPPPETFAQALRRIREADGTDRATVAHLLGVTQQAVEHWEYGNNTPIKEHYEKLLELFPELAQAPEPDYRDIPKPDGGSGVKKAFETFVEPLEAITPFLFPDVRPDLLSNDEPMNQITPDPVTNVNSKTLIVRFVKLALQVKQGENHGVLDLLREAREAGMTLDDVLEMLS